MTPRQYTQGPPQKSSSLRDNGDSLPTKRKELTSGPPPKFDGPLGADKTTGHQIPEKKESIRSKSLSRDELFCGSCDVFSYQMTNPL